MITSLDELRAFTEKEAKRRPAAAKHILLRTPGCSDEDIRQLRNFEPRLPPIYIDCIKKLTLKGISLPGYFRLWPGGNTLKGTFVEDFRMVNSPGWYHQIEFANMGLLRVASWNDADICLAKIGSPLIAPDAILRFADANQVTNPIALCQNFEQFVIAAGNVAEISIAERGTDAAKRVDILLTRLASIDLSIREIEAWRDIAEAVFT